MSNKLGRPTKYTPTMIELAEAYIKECSREQTQLPTIEGLADILNVDDDTIVEWGKEYPQFSATLKKIKAKQKNQLMNDGLYGGKEVNPAMAIFLLKANHGMKENDGITQDINVNIVLSRNEIPSSQYILPDQAT